MGIKRRQYAREQKEEIVRFLLSGMTALELGREYNISPALINRWRRQYLEGALNQGNNHQEIDKLKKRDSQTGADDRQTNLRKTIF